MGPACLPRRGTGVQGQGVIEMPESTWRIMVLSLVFVLSAAASYAANGAERDVQCPPVAAATSLH